MLLSELVNEVNFHIKKDHVSMVAMDPANVALVHFTLLSSAFVEYDVSEPRVLGLNMDNLKQILKRAKPTDRLLLQVDDELNRLVVTLQGETTRKFTLSLLDLDEKEHEIPDLSFAVTVETNSLLLSEAIEDMDVITDSVTFRVAGAVFHVLSEGHLSSGHVEITTDQETDIVMKGDNSEVSSKYSLEYLKKMIKGSKLTHSVHLQFAQDYPLRLEYKILDKLQLAMVLAPRVAHS